MSTTTTDIPTIAPKTTNLSEAQNLLRAHNGLDALPGYVVVVFEKLEHGGAKFSKIVNPDERFRRFFLPFFNSPEKYFAVAVSQLVLSYSFEAEAKLDNDVREFTLEFHLTYRASNPRMLADRKDQDPLKQLTNKIAHTIKRSCGPKNWEMVKNRFRELERVVLAGERPQINQYAATLGLEILSLELDRRLPVGAVVLDQTRINVDESIKKHELLKTEELELAKTTTTVEERKNQLRDRAAHTRQDELRKRDHQIKLDNVDQRYEVKTRELENELQLQDQINILHQENENRRFITMKTDAIGTAVKNVGEGINTPAGLQDGFNVGQQIGQTLRGQNGSALQTGLPGAPPLELPGKEDTLRSLLLQALNEVAGWPYPYPDQRALRSAILHIVAEASLAEEADKTVLQQHVEKLNQLGRDLQPPLTPTQFSLLHTFQNIEVLKSLLR